MSFHPNAMAMAMCTLCAMCTQCTHFAMQWQNAIRGICTGVQMYSKLLPIILDHSFTIYTKIQNKFKFSLRSSMGPKDNDKYMSLVHI